MVCWFFGKSELKATPSSRDGISYDMEMLYRKEGARFIMDLGNKIGLRYESVATGVVFLHRFYMFHSFTEFDRYVTACCCLFLAGKVEETPKKCKDIIRFAKTLLPEQAFAAFGPDPKEEVMTMERILLQTIKFDLQVEHPYAYLLKYAKCLKGDKAKLHKCVQMAWTFVNDSLCTTLSLQWEPEIIAIALMYLAGKLSKFEVVDWVGRHSHHLRWWDMLVEDMSMELLEDVCHQVLDLYTQGNRPGGGSGTGPGGYTSGVPAIAAAVTSNSNTGSGSGSVACGSGGVSSSNSPSTPRKQTDHQKSAQDTPSKKENLKRKCPAVSTPPPPAGKQARLADSASSSSPPRSSGISAAIVTAPPVSTSVDAAEGSAPPSRGKNSQALPPAVLPSSSRSSRSSGVASLMQSSSSPGPSQLPRSYQYCSPREPTPTPPPPPPECSTRDFTPPPPPPPPPLPPPPPPPPQHEVTTVVTNTPAGVAVPPLPPLPPPPPSLTSRPPPVPQHHSGAMYTPAPPGAAPAQYFAPVPSAAGVGPSIGFFQGHRPF